MADRVRRGTIERKVATGFATALVLLLVISWLSYRNTRRLIETNDLVVHTHEVLSGLSS